MRVVKLYGICYISQEKILVATFDSREMAEDYVEHAKLKKPRMGASFFIHTFKKKSLLSPYEEVWIEDPPTIPHNPEL